MVEQKNTETPIIEFIQNPSVSSFNPDEKVPRQPAAQRSDDVRRDTDTVKSPEIRIEDVERSFKSYLVDDIRPSVLENGVRVDVPVLYATPERWKAIQRDGHIRDNKGQLLAPVVVFKSTNIAPARDLEKNDILKGVQEGYQYTTRYSKQNTYSNFSVLQNTQPIREIYSLQTPDYLIFSFEVIVWCDTKRQLDRILENIIYYNGRGHGETFKFVSRLQNISIDTINATGSDRLVQAVIPYETRAYIALKSTDTELANAKRLSTSKTVIITELT